MKKLFRFLFARAVDADYEICPEEPLIAGLTESQLRSMDPDERVAVLEKANLDPYDYLYLCC